jgi:hypothetical protein
MSGQQDNKNHKMDVILNERIILVFWKPYWGKVVKYARTAQSTRLFQADHYHCSYLGSASVSMLHSTGRVSGQQNSGEGGGGIFEREGETRGRGYRPSHAKKD